ncbi:MAG: YggT family protein [Pseudomonadota bacterium]|jgi:YggT family protein
MLDAIHWLGATVLNLYFWFVIAAAVLSWLVAFNVINTYNQFIAMVMTFLYRVTEPALRPIRRFMPDLGGIDISPIVLLLLIQFVIILWHNFFASLGVY